MASLRTGKDRRASYRKAADFARELFASFDDTDQDKTQLLTILNNLPTLDDPTLLNLQANAKRPVTRLIAAALLEMEAEDRLRLLVHAYPYIVLRWSSLCYGDPLTSTVPGQACFCPPARRSQDPDLATRDDFVQKD